MVKERPVEKEGMISALIWVSNLKLSPFFQMIFWNDKCILTNWERFMTKWQNECISRICVYCANKSAEFLQLLQKGKGGGGVKTERKHFHYIFLINIKHSKNTYESSSVYLERENINKKSVCMFMAWCPGAVEVWCQGSCCGSSVVFVVLVMFLVLVLVCPHRKQIILTINSAALLSLPTTPPCAFDNTNCAYLYNIFHTSNICCQSFQNIC